MLDHEAGLNKFQKTKLYGAYFLITMQLTQKKITKRKLEILTCLEIKKHSSK